MERENLAGDAMRKGASCSHRKAESTDAPGRGGLLRRSAEAVMPVERMGQAIAFEIGSTGNERNPMFNKASLNSCLCVRFELHRNF